MANKNYTPLNLSIDEINLPFVSNDQIQQQWSAKELHGRHHYDLIQPHVEKDESNKWFCNGQFFSETEGFLVAIRDQVINTNNYRKYVIKKNIIGLIDTE